MEKRKKKTSHFYSKQKRKAHFWISVGEKTPHRSYERMRTRARARQREKEIGGGSEGK